MPTYEYRCPKGHSFEVFQKMSDPPIATCTQCGEAAERVLSGGAGFLFKGEGFYITDYRSADYKKKAEAERGAGGDSTTKKSGGGSEGVNVGGSGKKGSSSGGSDAGSGGGSSSGGSESSGGSGSSRGSGSSSGGEG